MKKKTTMVIYDWPKGKPLPEGAVDGMWEVLIDHDDITAADEAIMPEYAKKLLAEKRLAQKKKSS